MSIWTSCACCATRERVTADAPYIDGCFARQSRGGGAR